MNKLFTKLFLSLSASILMFGAVAQENPHKCGTDHELQRLLKEKPELRKKLEKAFSENQAKLKSYDDSTVYIVPVVFHVLHQNGPERISLNQIQTCLDALNANYRNTNASHADSYYVFDSLRGDAKIEFRLAQIDPYGNCTNGVDYVYTSETMIGDNNSKLNQWDRSKYLNIWTVNRFERGGGLLGFSMFPDAVSDGTFYMDGVMVLYSEVNSYSTTITHEVGHYLNLAHPWGFDNDPEVACGDDGVTDTPETKGFQSVCPTPSVNSSRTCTTVDHTIGMDFDSVRTDNGVEDLTINEVGEEVYLENFVYNGTALSSSLDSSFVFSDWSNGGVDSNNYRWDQVGIIDLNNYFETRVSVTGNNLLNINKLSFILSRSDDGPRSVALRSSVDNFSNNIALTSQNTSIAIDNSVLIDKYIYMSFDSVRTNNGVIDSTLNNTESGVYLKNFSYNGSSINSEVDSSFIFSDWSIGGVDGDDEFTNQTGTIDLNDFFETKVSSSDGSLLNLKEFTFVVSRSNNGARSFALRSSIDNFSSNISLTSLDSKVAIGKTSSSQGGNLIFYNDTTAEAIVKASFTNASFMNLTNQDTITFRLYAWNSEDVSGTFGLDSAAFKFNSRPISDNTIFFNDTTASAIVEASFSNASYLDLTDQDTVTFRLYAWNSEDVNGTFGLDSVTVRLKSGVIENIENYMDYANCPKMFTKGQIVRMRTALASTTSERNNLFSAENLIATGVNDDYVAGLCPPVADFYATAKTVCIDKNISFYESAWGGTVADYAWSFEDATPATSTSQNPTVKFNNPGYKTVSLIVSNSSGSDTLSKTIIVTGNWADFVGPKLIDFEDDYKYWFVPVNEHENETSFALAYGMGYDNSDCYVLQNFKDVSMAPAYSSDYFYKNRLGNDVDYLFSPSFDLRNTSGVTIKFKYAYATNGTVLTSNASQNADITEKMRVYAVRDCATTLGNTKKTISGAELLTAGYSSNLNFVPNSESQWKEFSLNYSTSPTYDGNVRFVIAFESSDVSNNLYIDDFFVDGFLGLEQQEISDMNLSVYPNPVNSSESINVSYIAGNNPVELVLRNAQGQVIYNTTVKTTNAQVDHSINVGSKLPAACYFLEVKNGEFKTIRKVVVM